MNYSVTWLREAELETIALWLASRSRDRIDEALEALDRRLGLNAPDEGESREDESYRVAFEGPIGIAFRVYQDARAAVVGQVWLHA